VSPLSQQKLAVTPEELSARIQRYKRLYRMTELNKKEFAQLLGKSLRIVHFWETGKTPISHINASSIVNALQKFGILCSEEWLLFGLGDDPLYNDKKLLESFLYPGQYSSQQDERIQQFNLDFSLSGLLAFYKKIYPEHLSCLVDDYRFAPRIIPTTLLIAIGVPEQKFNEKWIHGYLYTLDAKQIIPIDIKRQEDSLWGFPFPQVTYNAIPFPLDQDRLLFPIINVRPVY
jgi:hypothetical protein